VTLPPEALVSDALGLMRRYQISGVPVTDDDGTLVGILTNRDLRFAPDVSQPVSALMTSHDLVTAPIGRTLAEAEANRQRDLAERAGQRLVWDRPPRQSRQGIRHQARVLDE